MVQVHLMYNIKSHLTCFVATFKENIKVTTKTFGERKNYIQRRGLLPVLMMVEMFLCWTFPEHFQDISRGRRGRRVTSCMNVG